MHWFVQVQGQIYGPYNDGQMQSFVSQGRINAQSLISNNPAEGFYAASGYDIYALWAGTGQINLQEIQAPSHIQTGTDGLAAHSVSPATPHPAPYQPSQSLDLTPSPAAQTSLTPAQDEASHIFVIMAEIRSDNLMNFLASLQSFGPAERLGDSLWLLRSTANTDRLRNSLSQSLTRKDRMFIVDCSQNKTSWFNIGADLDSRIRHLWDEQG